MRQQEFSEPVREFVRAHNLAHRVVKVGDSWVRVRPSTKEEDEASAQNPRVIKFLQPGTVSHVSDILAAQNLVDIMCAGDRLLVAKDEFLSSWIRCIPEESWRETDRHRMTRQIGGTLV